MGWGSLQRGLRGSPLLVGCAAAALLVVLVTCLAAAQGYGGRPDPERTAHAMSVAATALFIAAGLSRIACWRIASEARSGYAGVALLAFGILAPLAPTTTPAPTGLLVAVAAVGLVRAAAALDRTSTLGQLRLAAVTADLDHARAALDAQRAWRRELSHDASNAMAALRLATTVMTTHGGRLAPERVETLQAAVLGEISHLDHLINRTSPETPSDFDVLATVAPIAAAQGLGGLDVSVVGERVRAHGNAADLATVVQNLLVNARHHGHGGAVTIRTERRDGTVGVVVEDRGPGIPEQQRRGIFDDGVRGDASEGSGLGLYVARRLMREQGGSIELGPPGAGPGASFVLTLPAAGFANPPVGVSR